MWEKRTLHRSSNNYIAYISNKNCHFSLMFIPLKYFVMISFSAKENYKYDLEIQFSPELVFCFPVCPAPTSAWGPSPSSGSWRARCSRTGSDGWPYSVSVSNSDSPENKITFYNTFTFLVFLDYRQVRKRNTNTWVFLQSWIKYE